MNLAPPGELDMANSDSTDIDPIFSDPRLAAIYDAFDPDRSDLLPYVKIINGFSANKVIDLGCGTGVLPLLLLENNVHVIAVDPAKASIDVARLKPNADKIEWIVGDASSLSNVSADVIAMTGNVAQAIIEPGQWKMTLDHIGSALKPGGHLVFETRNPHFQAWKQWNKKDSFQSISVPGIGLVDGWVELTKVDLPLVSFRWTYFFHKDGSTLRSDSTLRFRSLQDIAQDLNEHGFNVKEVREAPDRPGKEYVVIAQAATFDGDKHRVVEAKN
jgi:SAM-dependent methyltransferase